MNGAEKEIKNITTEANEKKLQELAIEINTIKKTTQRVMMQAAIDIGQRLLEVKTVVGHGNWGKWLAENVDYSERTAQNLIRIFEEYGKGEQSLFGKAANPQTVADLSVSQAIALLGIKDADERAEFIEENNVADMTKKELEQAIKERNEAQAETDKAKKAIEALQEDLTGEKDAVKRMEEALEKAKTDAAAAKEEGEKKLEQQKKSLQEELDKLKGELEAAKEKTAAGGESSEEKEQEIKKLEKALEKAKKDAAAAREEGEKKLEQQKKALAKELEEKTAALQEELKKANDTSRLEFAAAVNTMQKDFNELCRLADAQDGEKREKYRKAVRDLLRAMGKALAA